MFAVGLRASLAALAEFEARLDPITDADEHSQQTLASGVEGARWEFANSASVQLGRVEVLEVARVDPRAARASRAALAGRGKLSERARAFAAGIERLPSEGPERADRRAADPRGQIDPSRLLERRECPRQRHAEAGDDAPERRTRAAKGADPLEQPGRHALALEQRGQARELAEVRAGDDRADHTGQTSSSRTLEQVEQGREAARSTGVIVVARRRRGVDREL